MLVAVRNMFRTQLCKRLWDMFEMRDSYGQHHSALDALTSSPLSSVSKKPSGRRITPDHVSFLRVPAPLTARGTPNPSL